jgi:hypothetical protein
VTAAQDTGSCLLRCLDCLSKLCQSNEDNGQIVARYAPPGLFLRLHELLYVPANGLDSLPRGDGEKKAKAKEVPRSVARPQMNFTFSVPGHRSAEICVSLRLPKRVGAPLRCGCFSAH